MSLMIAVDLKAFSLPLPSFLTCEEVKSLGKSELVIDTKQVLNGTTINSKIKRSQFTLVRDYFLVT